MSNGDGHWAEGVEHSSITTENRESFNKAMSKYETPEDAHIGLMDAQKVIGAPFKLPESMDKLPDDKTRGELSAGIRRLTGAIENEAGLKDFPWTAGMAEGGEVDENLKALYSKFIIDGKMTRSNAERNVEFYNTMMGQAKEALINSRKQKMDETDKALTEYFKGEENYGVQKELLKRGLQSESARLTAEESGNLIKDLFDEKGRIYNNNPVLTKALINLIAPLQKEGTTEAGKGAGEQQETEKSFGEKEGLEKSSKVLWPEGEKK